MYFSSCSFALPSDENWYIYLFSSILGTISYCAEIAATHAKSFCLLAQATVHQAAASDLGLHL